MKFIFLLFFASCLYATPKANLSATGLYSDIACPGNPEKTVDDQDNEGSNQFDSEGYFCFFLCESSTGIHNGKC